MLRVKYKIEGEKPDLMKILNKISDSDYTINEEANILYLTILITDEIAMRELLRRLRPKKNRQTTEVTIVDKSYLSSKASFEQKIRFNNLGYKPKIQRKGYSYFLSVNKLIALGNNLNQGMDLYAYLGEDNLGRSLLVVYLDGDPRTNNCGQAYAEANSFLE
jgi:hypothetical protein